MATVRKRGNKWQVQVRRVGHRSISASFNVLKDAKAWARQKETEADRGALAPDATCLRRLTLGELVERYRDTVSVGKRGHDVERVVLNAFLRHSICRKPLSNVTSEDFAAYRDERLNKVSTSTLRREFSSIHHLFEVARDEWCLPLQSNPLDRVRVGPAPNGRERRLKPGELEKLVEAGQSCRNRWVLPVILFAVETAMRRSEVLAVRWEHVRDEEQSLLIPQTKNGYSRIIPLSPGALELLSGLPVIEDRVFPITAIALRLAWDRIKRRACVADLHFHDLRHEAISRFFERGLTLPEVALISGHRDARMLFRYTHPARGTNS